VARALSTDFLPPCWTLSIPQLGSWSIPKALIRLFSTQSSKGRGSKKGKIAVDLTTKKNIEDGIGKKENLKQPGEKGYEHIQCRNTGMERKGKRKEELLEANIDTLG